LFRIGSTTRSAPLKQVEKVGHLSRKAMRIALSF